MLASDLPYGEVATSAALAAIRRASNRHRQYGEHHIGEIALVANPKSNIHKVQDLAGKKAGFTNPKSTSELLLRFALKQAGMADKVEPVSTGGFGAGLTALDTGGVDAAPLIDPILTLQARALPRHLPFADLIPRMTWLVGITTRKFAKENPETVRKLIGYIVAPSTTSTQNRDEAMRIYAKVWKPIQASREIFPEIFHLQGRVVTRRLRKGGAEKMSEGMELVGESNRPGRLEGGDRSAIPAEGQQKPM